ncbi:MAG TPA: RHS repeat-associated core domain-containing protein [Niastella sp.]
MTRVLGAATFLSATNYYDEKGLLIQSLEDNIKTGTNITTLQYNFDGRIMSTCSDHTTTGTGFSHFITLTKNNFDKLGRVTAVQKQFGSNAFKTVATYDYDDIGRIKTKHFDPDYTAINGRTGSGLESLEYSFNIHNQITGINKDYALKNPANYNKWEHFFGLYLGFDNKDNVFTKSQLNGQVTGLLWNTQGDDAQRKYDYTYDNANRLINAAFSEQKRPGDGWSNSKMDFSVTGTSGKITYDLNGNLLNMLQKGVMPGTAAPITIDELSYTYASYSNKLQSVTDQMLTTNVNGLSGDFKDGSNGTAPDYVYDNNGNVVIDLNKNAKDLENVVGANGISYNYLDKPEKIHIAGKGTIRIVYNGDGQKLQRAFIPESGSAATITSYINQFVYQETSSVTTTTAPPFSTSGGMLSYIGFEEGRIRAITPTNSTQDGGLDAMAINGNITLPDGRMGVFDYFVKDYQANVRMVLTEETHSAHNTCTMETSRSTAEVPIFGQSGGANEVESTRYPKPSGWQNANLGSSVSRLGNNAGHNMGPNTLQKVMAGDQVSATVQYYYVVTGGGSNPNLVSTVLSSLAQAITGGGAATSMVKANATGITNQLNGTSGFINAVQPAGGGGRPQAYLTILFFDERFNFIEAADGGVVQQQVGASGSDPAPIGLGAVKAPKNGYAFVYVSNQNDEDVYFDNLKVGITRGNIIEENHYYAYGLRIAAISSRKAGDINEGKLKNDYLYNDKELFDDADLNWYDYGFRNYDAQIGRFPQLDPLTDMYPILTPYQYAICDPITNIDVDGLAGGGAVGAAVGAGGDVFQGSKTIMQATVIVTAIRTVKAAETATTLTSLALSITSISIQTAVTTANIVNCKINTLQVGGNPPLQVTTQQLLAIFPNANKNLLNGLAETLNTYMAGFGIDNELELAHFLAQAGHETGGFKKGASTEGFEYKLDRAKKVFGKYFVHITDDAIQACINKPQEFASYVYGNRNGNGQEITGDGYKYRGRGIYQLTGKSNYKAFTDFYKKVFKEDVDFVAQPELVASNIKYAVISALWYFNSNTRKIKLSGTAACVTEVSKAVNGGLNGLADRQTIFKRAFYVLILQPLITSYINTFFL